MKRGEDDLLRSFLPQSFGTKKQKVSANEQINETRRTRTVKVVRKRKIDETEEQAAAPVTDGGLSIAEASKAIISDDSPSIVGRKGYVVIGPPKPTTRFVEEEEEIEVEEEDIGANEYDSVLPISHEIKLKGHLKVESRNKENK